MSFDGSGLFSSNFTPVEPVFQTPKTQGQDANISGRLCEKTLRDAFEARHVSVLPWRKQSHDLFHDQVLFTNVPYTSIYGSQSRSEMVYQHRSANIAVRIECRIQQTSGSVDEKFPFLFKNACRVEEKAVWLVISGEGARLCAMNWLKRKALSHGEKIIRVYTENEARKAVKYLVEEGVYDKTFNKPKLRLSF